MSNPAEEIPNITLPLPDYLEDLWTYNKTRTNFCGMCSTISRVKGELIALLDKTNRWCYVEFDPAYPAIARVWPIKEWRDSYEKRRVQEAKRVQYEVDRDKTLAYHTTLVCRMKEDIIGMMMTDEQVNFLAWKFLKERDVAKLKKFGVELTDGEQIVITLNNPTSVKL